MSRRSAADGERGHHQNPPADRRTSPAARLHSHRRLGPHCCPRRRAAYLKCMAFRALGSVVDAKPLRGE